MKRIVLAAALLLAFYNLPALSQEIPTYPPAQTIEGNAVACPNERLCVLLLPQGERLLASSITGGWTLDSQTAGNRTLLLLKGGTASADLLLSTDRRVVLLTLASGGSASIYALPPAQNTVSASYVHPEPHAPSLYFNYGWKKARFSNPPTRIYDDGSRTYITLTHSRTLPAVFELDTENKPTLVNYTADGNTIVVDRILQRGRLLVGKTALDFERK